METSVCTFNRHRIWAPVGKTSRPCYTQARQHFTETPCPSNPCAMRTFQHQSRYVFPHDHLRYICCSSQNNLPLTSDKFKALTLKRVSFTEYHLGICAQQIQM